ncbi:site-specific DNA-methyltransferase (cytosine-N4-specific) [Chryseobacterium arachidis]|uniref:Methyltransferase n=2 Tax=Chryseobacterium arachidis TaxID=1416778 RepID=A0A1M4XX47_9FLAO|nr:site-specific DNA-methyltransferase [Chryseobacterium arachidis]SHE98137.1 site-specific DNA-methyltransferase (cytosine-N4-specific) [Chryseobacterium arachidis]
MLDEIKQNKKYKSKLGKLIVGNSLELLKNDKKLAKLKGKVNLIVTSPPFPLNNKKQYGNEKGEEYKDWFIKLAPIFSDLLADNGSLVIEIGNAWEPERPVQSLLHLECLLGMVKHPEANLRLIQEFICYNPSKLPSPAQWVTVNRLRTVDSYTHVWWIAKNDFPKADNSKVLRPYSKSMEQLLKKQSYNAGKRPSEHQISEKGFLKDNGGSISHNFFEMEALDENREVRLPHSVLSFSNTNSNGYFLKTCREKGIMPHPARMSGGLVNFFIQFLTDEEDLVLDPFSGSNTTGYCAEKLNRKWISFEIKEDYIEQAIIRFSDPDLKSPLK